MDAFMFQVMEGIRAGMQNVVVLGVVGIVTLVVGHGLLVKSSNTIFANRRRVRGYDKPAA